MKYNTFEFSSYKLWENTKKVSFYYVISDGKNKLKFTEELVLPRKINTQKVPQELLNNLLINLHLILGVSYYKLYCPPKIKMNYKLSKEQADFWGEVYTKGLGELIYKNKIDPQGLVRFPFHKVKFKKTRSFVLQPKDRLLVGMGGGKESVVALELFKDKDIDISAFVVETQRQNNVAQSVIKKSQTDSLVVRRVLDPKLFDLPSDALQGHIPISAIYGFLGVFTSVVYDYAGFAVGNEYSSNFGNTKYKGLTINHQWSKTSEFENLFTSYINKFVVSGVRYFSILRPFYEIRIAKMFSEYKEYFDVFASCNSNFKINQTSNSLWCGRCAKCVFAYTILSPFLVKKELLSIFGKNLYEDKSLEPIFKDILGFGKMKPFDCVGTFDEARVALHMSRKNYKNSYIVSKYAPKITNSKKLLKKLMKTQPSNNIPDKYKFLGLESALILGYAREGIITEKYLKKFYPKLKIGIADQKEDKNYLDKQKNYDIVIKTPGISKEKVNTYYTTGTNIFFSEFHSRIIGVTGSAGKSTTSSLIYQVLQDGGREAYLVGNIGRPMMEILLEETSSKALFVVELSSYQLDDIKYSPHIAVVTELFPEHMTYHRSVENYYEAKKNILKLQSEDDYFVYNPGVVQLQSWIKDMHSQPVAYDKLSEDFFENIKLLGEHNKQNIRAAATVGRLLGINTSSIKKSIKKFNPLPHRLEYLGTFKKIKFYNDSISTTPQMTIAAIETLSKQTKVDTVILGGEDRGYDFVNLKKTLLKHKIKNIVLFPDSGKHMKISKKDFNILHTKSMGEAVKFAYAMAESDTICLLSPASPSYNLFVDYEDRGEQFRQAVKELAK